MQTCMTLPKQAYWNSAPRPAWQEIHVSSSGNSGCTHIQRLLGALLTASAYLSAPNSRQRVSDFPASVAARHGSQLIAYKPGAPTGVISRMALGRGCRTHLEHESCVNDLAEQGRVRLLEALVHLQPSIKPLVIDDHQHNVMVPVPAYTSPRVTACASQRF